MRSINNIAKEVRRKTEVNAHKRKFSDSCEGLCGDASIALKNSLKSYGYKAYAFYGEFIDENGKHHHHCWTETDDELIDLTATQFGIEEKVFRIKINSAEYDKLYRKISELKSIQDVSDNYNYSQLVVRKPK